MHKLITTLILSILMLCCLNAQEKLVNTIGDTLSIKLIELNEKYVIYNKSVLKDERVFTTPISKYSKLIYKDGTVLNLGRENIVIIVNGQAQSIKKPASADLYVKKGFWGPKVHSKEKSYSSKEMDLLYKKIGNLDALRLFRKGQNQNVFANVIGIPASFIFGYQLGNSITGQKTNPSTYITSGLAVIVSIALGNSALRKIKKSVASYNDSVISRLGVSENGIGLILDF